MDAGPILTSAKATSSPRVDLCSSTIYLYRDESTRVLSPSNPVKELMTLASRDCCWLSQKAAAAFCCAFPLLMTLTRCCVPSSVSVRRLGGVLLEPKHVETSTPNPRMIAMAVFFVLVIQSSLPYNGVTGPLVPTIIALFVPKVETL